jgi:hypothetical protein
VRTHHRKDEAVRKKPAMSHQPPSFSGGMEAVLRKRRLQRQPEQLADELTGSQFTEASMLRPMISKAMKPNSRDSHAGPAQVDGADLRVADPAHAQ